MNGNMEEDELGGGKQIYDVIEDSDDENSKFKTQDLKTQLTAVRGKRGTFAERRENATTEATGDKKNILHKLKEKFSRKSTEDDSFECHEQSDGSSPSTRACFLPVVGDETLARRRAFGDMHNSSKSFPSPGKASATGVSKSRSKMLAFGKLGILKKSKNGNMLMPEHNYERVDNSCRHLPNSSLSDQHEAPFSELIQNSALPSNLGESDPPPIPDRPQPQTAKQQQRCRAKSITFPLDHDSFAGKEINFEKWKKADPSYDHSKCKSATSAPEQNSDEVPSLSNNLEKLSHYSWYWGPINRFEAEEQLHGKPDGSFLVRDSSHEFHLYSVSFRSKGQTLHTRIKYDKGRFGFLTPTGLHPETNSVVALVKKSMKLSQRGHMGTSRAGITWPTFPIQFIYPVTRFDDLPSLKHLCRFVIRQNSRCDKLHELPLPPKLIRYLDVDNHFLPEAELQKRRFTEG